MAQARASSSHPPRLDAREEIRLAVIARGKSRHANAARNRLIMSECGLIRVVAQTYRRADIRYEDLLQEGALGLLRAAESFDPGRGVRFGTYALYWVRSKMQRFVERQRRHTHPGMAGVASTLCADGRRHFPRTSSMSMETPAGPESAFTLGDSLVDVDAGTPESRVMASQEQARVVREVWDACRVLGDPRLEVVVQRRILSQDPETLAQVGRRLLLSGEGARLLEARVMSVVRAGLQDLAEARNE